MSVGEESPAAGVLLVLAFAGGLPAQEKPRITVEWIFSDAGEEPTRLPPFAWTSGGDLLLLDTRKPKEARTFERVTPTGRRASAVDRAAAWSSLKELVGEAGLPETLGWPASLDRAGRWAVYVLADDLFLLDLGASRFERLTRTPEKEAVPRFAHQHPDLGVAVRGGDRLLELVGHRRDDRVETLMGRLSVSVAIGPSVS